MWPGREYWLLYASLESFGDQVWLSVSHNYQTNAHTGPSPPLFYMNLQDLVILWKKKTYLKRVWVRYYQSAESSANISKRFTPFWDAGSNIWSWSWRQRKAKLMRMRFRMTLSETTHIQREGPRCCRFWRKGDILRSASLLDNQCKAPRGNILKMSVGPTRNAGSQLLRCSFHKLFRRSCWWGPKWKGEERFSKLIGFDP